LGVDLEAKNYPKTANSGEPSTSKEALATIKDPVEAVEWVAAYREYDALRKRSNDFISKYASLVGDKGTIRGSYTKNVSTGRLSCRRPNLQQVPKRGELQSKEGMRIRDIFRASPGDVFVVADFEQVELLLAATLAQEETMLAIFERGEDVHTETASWVLGKPKDEVSKEERTLAKALNFGLIYGCSADKLRESATNNYGVPITLNQAKQYRRTFFEKYPRLAEWHVSVEKECNAGQQYTTTPLGRRRKMPVWENSNTPAHTVAKNASVQGAGADAIKLTMAKLFEDRHNCPGNPRLNASVHDEIVLSVAEEHKDAAIEWVKRHMAQAEREAVGDPDSPIHVDVEALPSWGG